MNIETQPCRTVVVEKQSLDWNLAPFTSDLSWVFVLLLLSARPEAIGSYCSQKVVLSIFKCFLPSIEFSNYSALNTWLTFLHWNSKFGRNMVLCNMYVHVHVSHAVLYPAFHVYVNKTFGWKVMVHVGSSLVCRNLVLFCQFLHCTVHVMMLWYCTTTSLTKCVYYCTSPLSQVVEDELIKYHMQTIVEVRSQLNLSH